MSNLWSWGSGQFGALGNSSASNISSPALVTSPGLNWVQTTGTGHAGFGIKNDGTLWTWGRGADGQLGYNSVTDRSSPGQTISTTKTWKTLSYGVNNRSISAIKTDGTLWLWGNNSYGQLGNNDRTSRSSPVQTVSGGTNWVYAAAGNVSAAGIKGDGTLWTWGRGNNGALGNNSTASRSSPAQTTAGGSNWKNVTVGGTNVSFMLAIKTDGTLWSWGYNSFGTLGTGTNTDRSSPAQVGSSTNWKDVKAGYKHVIGLKTEGTLWTWGFNDVGQLGTNDNTYYSSPVQTIAGGTDWKQITIGGATSTAMFMAAIKNNGTLWTWGGNNYGQLGIGDTTNRSSPTQVGTDTNWRQVGGGYRQCFATKFIY